MKPDRPGDSSEDALICADVLGAFGVSQTDLHVDAGTSGESLDEILTDALSDARDRTAFLRQTICRSARGIDCSARYSTSSLARELTETFEAIGWTLAVEERGRDRGLHLRASDGRVSRETIATYPETPLEADNLPAVLAAIDDRLLFGVDAQFVLLSSGVDRWRAALIETDELERVRASYGERVSVFDRPLLPEYGLEAYAVDEDEGESDEDEGSQTPLESGPWPEWALERASRRSVSSVPTDGERTQRAPGTAASEVRDRTSSASTTKPATEPTSDFIVEAEPDRASPPATRATTVRRVTESVPESDDPPNHARAGRVRSRDGFELVGSSRVSRVANGSDGRAIERSDGHSSSEQTRERSSGSEREENATEESREDTTSANDREAVLSRREKRETSTSGFGTLSGSTKTARVSNDSFGAEIETPTEDDRYRALGAAIGTGKNISVRGLLDDEEFLPRLPAVEPLETRIEYEECFDPDALPRAKAVAEESGFVWVDSGSLQSTRVRNG